MKKTVSLALLAVVVMAPGAAVVAQETSVSKFVDLRYAETARIARTLWEYAEVGYQEERSSALLQSALAAEGFDIDAGVADIPTAFVASYGDTGPVIGILAEFDALPGINQDSVPTRSPIEGKGAGHACGHNLFGAGSVGAAIAAKHWLDETGAPGIIRLYGTPAQLLAVADVTGMAPGARVGNVGPALSDDFVLGPGLNELRARTVGLSEARDLAVFRQPFTQPGAQANRGLAVDLADT